MQFHTVETRQSYQAIYATGPIESGDSARLEKALDVISSGKDGYKMIFLNSPGGSVAEAARMGRVISDARVMTIVGWGDRCVSACASKLFVSGKARLVVGNGLLGFHTCYDPKSNSPLEKCNEYLAMSAMGNGIAHGDIKAWLMNPSPEEIIYLDQASADCWNLSLWPHQVGKPRSMSECAQASIFRNVIELDGESIGDNPVPKGAGAVAFAQHLIVPGRWRLIPLDDGLRASFIQLDDGSDFREATVSCSEDYPGHMFVAFGYGSNSVRNFASRIRSFEVAIGSKTILFDANGPMAQLSVEDDRIDMVALITPENKNSVIDNISGMAVKAYSNDGKTIYKEYYDTSEAADYFMKAANNCTVQFVHTGLR